MCIWFLTKIPGYKASCLTKNWIQDIDTKQKLAAEMKFLE